MSASGNPFLLTRILATVGPACADPVTLAKMIEEGVRVFRVNCSHGDLPQFQATVDLIRQASLDTGQPVGILGDLSGPKIRVTSVEGGAIELAAGDTVRFTTRDVVADRDADSGVVTVGTTYPEMVDDVADGQRLLVNDGAIRMLVTGHAADPSPQDPGGKCLVATVTVGGTLSNKKGVNLPDTDVSAPALTEWDEECAAWAVEAGCDFLALSFVRKAADVHRLNELLKTLGRDNTDMRSHTSLPIIAKIEKPQAIDELDGILDAADGVMVARGDLGVEMDLACVPVMQKTIIRRAHAHGKPVIVATQMLESMIENPYPTRAEVSDVANAIIDGADAVMCSGETAVGKHPLEVIRVMARTATLTEAYDADQRAGTTRPPANLKETRYRTAALAHGVSTIVNDLVPKCVVMWSELGGGARYLSQNRLRVPVVAVSGNQVALRRMSLHFGVHPVFMERPVDGIAFVESVDGLLVDNGWADPGDGVVIVKGDPLGIPGVTNQIRIHYVGDVCRLTWHPK